MSTDVWFASGFLRYEYIPKVVNRIHAACGIALPEPADLVRLPVRSAFGQTVGGGVLGYESPRQDVTYLEPKLHELGAHFGWFPELGLRIDIRIFSSGRPRLDIMYADDQEDLGLRIFNAVRDLLGNITIGEEQLRAADQLRASAAE